MAASQITPIDAGQQADTNTSAPGAHDSNFDAANDHDGRDRKIVLVPSSGHDGVLNALAVKDGAVGAPLTMSSREIAELTDKRHDHVMRDIENMLADLGDTSPQFWGDLPDSYNRPQRVAFLPKRETLILVSGYCIALRAKLIDRWQELEEAAARPALPNFADPVAAARAWADAVEARQQAQIERDHAVRTKAEIGTRREATAMARASTAVREANRLKAQLGRSQTHATVLAVERASGKSFGPQGWRLLRKWCADHSLTPESVHDPRYGTVKAWPADAWGTVYGIDLAVLFPVAEQAAD